MLKRVNSRLTEPEGEGPSTTLAAIVDIVTGIEYGSSVAIDASDCGNSQPVGNPYARRVGTSDEPMTVTLKDFYADWCGPCKTQDPILEELEDDWEGRFEVEKVNVDEQQDIANEYQVRSLPTLIIENDDEIVERFVGVTQRDDIEDALESAGA